VKATKLKTDMKKSQHNLRPVEAGKYVFPKELISREAFTNLQNGNLLATHRAKSLFSKNK